MSARMSRYQIGDLVTPVKPATEREQDMWPKWIFEMECTVGHVYQIRSIINDRSDGSIGYTLEISDDDLDAPGAGYYYREEWLELFSRPYYELISRSVLDFEDLL